MTDLNTGLKNDLHQSKNELNFNHSVSSMMEKPELSIKEILSDIIESSLYYITFPVGSRMRIIHGNHTYQASNFHPSTKVARRSFNVNGNDVGCIEIHIPCDEELSDAQEHSLLILSETIGRICTGKLFNEQFLAMYENSNDGVCIVEKQGEDYCFVRGNTIFEQHIGAKMEDLKDKPFKILPIISDEKSTEFTKLLDENDVIEQLYIDYYNPILDTDEYTLMNARALMTQGRRIFLCSFKDYSELISVKNSEKEAFELSQTLIDSLPICVALVDETGKLMYANKKLLDEGGDIGIIGNDCISLHANGERPYCEHCPVPRRFISGDFNQLRTKSPDGKRIYEMFIKSFTNNG
ncbi:MAG: hypothetical protein ACK5IQ_01865, partial [Bacteroidales bacterium]